MIRLLFEKTDTAVWMSHLDLMRVFQRSFKRAGLPLTHTKGFNPRPSVSIALPLSVGVESQCELLDFDLEGDPVPEEEILRRLNACLVPGVKGLACYQGGRKLRDLALLQCRLTLEYDRGIPQGAMDAISDLFSRESLVVSKKGKNGPVVFVLEGYLTRYGLADWAKGRYADMHAKASDCIQCAACENRCPYHLPIRNMMAQVAEKFEK